jgi:hypothetical protein
LASKNLIAVVNQSRIETNPAGALEDIEAGLRVMSGSVTK